MPFPANGPMLSASALQDKNASVAKVSVTKITDYSKGADYAFEATGSAKREQGDVYDPLTGEMLAMSRALQSAARQLQSEANKRVAKAMEDKAAAEKAAAEAKERAKTPPKKRTKAEWEAMVKRGVQEHRRKLKASVKLVDGRTLEVEDHYATLVQPGRIPVRFNLNPG
jgi:uncharacterized protein (DUF3084 family)